MSSEMLALGVSAQQLKYEQDYNSAIQATTQHSQRGDNAKVLALLTTELRVRRLPPLDDAVAEAAAVHISAGRTITATVSFHGLGASGPNYRVNLHSGDMKFGE